VYSSTDPLVLELEGLHAYVDDISSEISHITNDLDRNRYRLPTIVKEVLDASHLESPQMGAGRWASPRRVMGAVHEPTLANMEA
jgi:hypothetical protein